jgi:hypothetical protein
MTAEHDAHVMPLTANVASSVAAGEAAGCADGMGVTFESAEAREGELSRVLLTSLGVVVLIVPLASYLTTIVPWTMSMPQANAYVPAARP